MRRIVDYAKLVVLVSATVSIFGLAPPAGATDSVISAQVCDDTSLAQIVIVAPSSDMILRKSPLTLEIDVSLVNQVEIYVDDAYRSVVAIPYGQTGVSATVDLVEGTQTIEVRGVGICDGDAVQDGVVVSYDPPASPVSPVSPSDGTKTPTVISPTPSSPSAGGQGGVVVSNPDPTVDNPPAEGVAWWRAVLDWLDDNRLTGWLIRFGDVDTTAERLPSNWLRIVALVAGLALLTWGYLDKRPQLRAGLMIGGAVLALASLLLFL